MIKRLLRGLAEAFAKLHAPETPKPIDYGPYMSAIVSHVEHDCMIRAKDGREYIDNFIAVTSKEEGFYIAQYFETASLEGELQYQVFHHHCGNEDHVYRTFAQVHDALLDSVGHGPRIMIAHVGSFLQGEVLTSGFGQRKPAIHSTAYLGQERFEQMRALVPNYSRVRLPMNLLNGQRW